MASVHRIPDAGPPVRSGADALGLLYEDGAADADWIAVPVVRLDPSFFDLSSGVAGDVVQKFANYRARLAIVGDITAQVAASTALRDFVRESNRGAQLWFVADDAELTRRLGP